MQLHGSQLIDRLCLDRRVLPLKELLMQAPEIACVHGKYTIQH